MFTISGQIVERESRQGVAGLHVRAYDADLLYDDLLGTVVTSQDGRFTMTYREEDFAELFEGRPDIYLTVDSPLGRRLLDSREHIRWGASEHESFTLVIARATLGHCSPSAPRGRVAGGLTTPRRPMVEQRGDRRWLPLPEPHRPR